MYLFVPLDPSQFRHQLEPADKGLYQADRWFHKLNPHSDNADCNHHHQLYHRHRNLRLLLPYHYHKLINHNQYYPHPDLEL